METKQFVTLKVPANLDLESLNLSKSDAIKAIFLISQINYRGNFNLHFNKLKKLFGLNSKSLTHIINKLTDSDIIYKTKQGRFKECNSYALVAPYDVTKVECETISYKFEDNDTPTFINRFIYDGHKYNINSTYTQRKASVKSKVTNLQLNSEHVNTESDTIDNLKAEVEQLKKLVSTLTAQIRNQDSFTDTNEKKAKGKKRATIDDIIKADIVYQPNEIVQPEALNPVAAVFNMSEAHTKIPVIKEHSEIVLITEKDEKPIFITMCDKKILFKNYRAFSRLEQYKQGSISSEFRIYFNKKYKGEMTFPVKNEEYNFYFNFEMNEITFVSYSIKKLAA